MAWGRGVVGIQVRRAASSELGLINERYAEVQFLASAQNDFLVVAEIGGQPAGLGRIVPIDAGIGELGGMYVFEEFRGLGVSKAIIAFLVAGSEAAALYCLPFADLQGLYESFGFGRVADVASAPDKVRHKLRWCDEFYDKPVLLMRLNLTDTRVEHVAGSDAD